MFKNLTEKMREGVKLQGAEDVAEFLTHSVRDALGEKYPAFFQTDFGKAIEPLVVPALVSELAKMLQNKVAGTEKIAAIADKAIVSISGDVVKRLVTTYAPGLLSLFSIGALADIALEDDDDE